MKTARQMLDELRQACDYDPDGNGGGLEDLIAYKEALEDLVAQLVPTADAWETMDRALRANARGESHSSAADVCAIGFALQKRLTGARVSS